MPAVFLGMTMLAAADEGPRSRVHLTAVRSYCSLSVPWDLSNPEVQVPLKLPRSKSGLAIFIGHVQHVGSSGNNVVGGDLMIRVGPNDRTFPAL